MCTAYAQGHSGGMWGRFSRRLARDSEIVDLLFKLRGKVTDLEQRADALEAAHQALRGKLYQVGAHKPPPDAPAAPRSKGEVLREYFTPGRPAKHSE